MSSPIELVTGCPVAFSQFKNLFVTAPSGGSACNSWHGYSLSQPCWKDFFHSFYVRMMHFYALRVYSLCALGFLSTQMAFTRLGSHDLACASDTKTPFE